MLFPQGDINNAVLILFISIKPLLFLTNTLLPMLNISVSKLRNTENKINKSINDLFGYLECEII